MTERAAESARQADPCILAIFGGAGDLTRRLLAPALCNLVDARLLPERFAVIAIARTAMETDAYRRHLEDGLRRFADPKLAPATRRWLLERSSYLRGSFDDPAVSEHHPLPGIAHRVDVGNVASSPFYTSLLGGKGARGGKEVSE